MTLIDYCCPYCLCTLSKKINKAENHIKKHKNIVGVYKKPLPIYRNEFGCYICPICKDDTIRKRNKHFSKKHGDLISKYSLTLENQKSPLYCPYCFEPVSEKAFSSHVTSKHSDKSNLNLKLVSFPTDFYKTVQCPVCNLEFCNFNQLSEHYILHFENTNLNQIQKFEDLIQCPYCDSMYKRTVFKDHLEKNHNVNFPWKNILYGETKKLLERRIKSILMTEKLSEDNYKCICCSYTNNSKNDVIKHYRKVHFKKFYNKLENFCGPVTTNIEGIYCPFNTETHHKNLYVNGHYTISKINKTIPLFYCYTCEKNIISVSDLEPGERKSKSGKIIYNIPDLFSDKFQKIEKKEEILDIPSSKGSKNFEIKQTEDRTLEYVNFSNFLLIVYDIYPKTACFSGEHDKEEVIINTKLFSNIDTKINAFHCKKCNKFFTNYEAIKPYFKSFKPLIRIHCEYLKEGRREFSELNLYGYNVLATDLGYDTSARRNILRTILDNNLVERHTITNLLKSLININGKGPNMKHARECWTDDLNFVSTYQVSNNKKINVSNLTIKYKNRIIH